MDISHLHSKNIPPSLSGGYHVAIIRQIEAEETSPLLKSELFPLLVGRELQCTSHAARRMREIVQTMGTATEKARADILLGGGSSSTLSKVSNFYIKRKIYINLFSSTALAPTRIRSPARRPRKPKALKERPRSHIPQAKQGCQIRRILCIFDSQSDSEHFEPIFIRFPKVFVA